MSKAQGIVFSLSLIIVGVLSFKLYQQSAQKEPEDVKAAYLTAGDFMLESGGETFSSKTLRGQPYILYFGFTSCPD
ncbi:SCO family protein, partial [Oleiphilus sp. HI0066]|uniref:SCO family protein n=2 Tax=Oleiphilus TaxID=141450 RepID=UPI000A8DFB1B